MAEFDQSQSLGRQPVWRQALYCFRIGSYLEALQVLVSGYLGGKKRPWQH